MTYRDEREALRAQKAELERRLAEREAENERLERRLARAKKRARRTKKAKRSRKAIERRGPSSLVPWSQVEALIREASRRKWRPAQVGAVGLVLALAIGSVVRGATIVLFVVWCIAVFATALSVALRAPCCGRRLTTTGSLLLQKTRQCPSCHACFER